MNNFVRLMKYVTRYWHIFALGLGLVAVSRYLSVVPSLMTRTVLNALTPPIDTGAVYGMLLPVILTIIGATLGMSLVTFVQNYTQQYASQKVVYDLRNDLFRSLTRESFSFFDKSRVGDMVSRLTSDVDRVQSMTSMWFNQIASLVAGFAIWLGVLFSINTVMTLICLSTVPVVLLVTYRYQELSAPIYQDQRTSISEMNTFLQQNVIGTRVVRVFRQEKREKDRFSVINKRYLDLQVKLAKIRALYPGLTTLTMGIVTGLIYWYGGKLIIQTYGTPAEFRWGDLLIFVQGMMSLMAPLRFLSSIAQGYSESMAATARIFEVLDSRPEVEEKPDATVLPNLRGEVVFENVSFGYNHEKPVLKNINLRVQPGETVAILGPTGSGKSSLLWLIPRFYDVTAGRITIDGYDIRDLKLHFLREEIGIALQEVFLFSATIKENIAYGRPTATLEDVIAAAKAAQIHDFITSLPNGYDTVVGERGVTLSGGQKQRITIARTLLKDPRILIFDDTTSFVDTETEHKIQQAMEALLKGRTTFIVTQRLSTIKNAHTIIVLKDGEIAEQGTHEELLAKNGIYASIYQTQFAPTEEIAAKTGNGGKK